MIEGNLFESASRKIDQNAIHGMLATITLSYKIPLIQTNTPLETAKLFMTIARREQTDEKTNN